MQNELDSSSAGTGKEKKETADEMLFVVLAYDVETFVTVASISRDTGRVRSTIMLTSHFLW